MQILFIKDICPITLISFHCLMESNYVLGGGGGVGLRGGGEGAGVGVVTFSMFFGMTL